MKEEKELVTLINGEGDLAIRNTAAPVATYVETSMRKHKESSVYETRRAQLSMAFLLRKRGSWGAPDWKTWPRRARICGVAQALAGPVELPVVVSPKALA